jgi:hypothetical protein
MRINSRLKLPSASGEPQTITGHGRKAHRLEPQSRYIAEEKSGQFETGAVAKSVAN